VFILTELGSRLKEARLSKGYSLDDLQEITKIQKRYLQAIEEGNHSIMPGAFYVRAFIKQYAEAVGLDGEQLLTNYQSEIPGAQVEQVTQSMSQSPSRRKSSKGPSNKLLEAMPKYIVALFIVVILVFVVFLWQQKTQKDEDNPIVKEEASQVEIEKKPVKPEKPQEVEKKEEPSTDKDKNTEETPAIKQEISEGTVESDGATTTYNLTGAKEMKLRVEVSGDTWVGVRNEAGVELVQPTTFKAGQLVEVDASTAKSARIRLGASQNAKVYINEELVQYAAPDRTTQNIVIVFNKEEQ